MSGLTEQEIDSLRAELSRAEIRDALLRYCRGVDRADRVGFLSAFHPEAREDHGPYHGPVEEFATLTTGRVAAGTLGIQHFLGNMLVELDGNVARVETYFMATYRPKNEPAICVAVAGRYLDRFERRDGPWLIAKRHVVNDWSWREPMSVDAPGMTGYPASRSDAEDAVFLPTTWQAFSEKGSST